MRVRVEYRASHPDAERFPRADEARELASDHRRQAERALLNRRIAAQSAKEQRQ